LKSFKLFMFLETLEFAGRMISAGWFICAKIEAETVPGT